LKLTEFLSLAETIRSLQIPITGISLPQEEWNELVADVRTGHPPLFKQIYGDPTSLKLKGLHVELRRSDEFSLENYLLAQIRWSDKTFGPGPRTEGILRHIGKEVHEVRASPTDLEEWIDIVILALDGAWRAGYSPPEIMQALLHKQQVNRDREYPPPGPQDQPIEHIRRDLE